MLYYLLACAKQKIQDTASTEDQTSAPTEVSDTLTIDSTPVTVTVNGQIDNIYALKDSSTVLAWGTNDNGAYTLWNVDMQTHSVTELPEELPLADQRSYNKPLQLQNGNLAICYQSDSRFSGQDGTQHGVLIIDPLTGDQIADVALNTSSNPEGLVENNGRLYVLAANRQTDQVPSLIVLNSNTYAILAEQTLNTSARNASDLDFYTDKNGEARLVISATTTEVTDYDSAGTNGVLNNAANGQVLVVDPDTLSVVTSHVTAANMGMDLAIDDETNLAVLSGVSTDAAPLAFGVLDLDGVSGTSFDEHWLGDIISEQVRGNGVGGVFPFGVTTQDGIMTTNFIDGDNGLPTPTVMDLGSSEYTVLDTVEEALISTPLIDSGEGHLVYAASGTSIDGAGHLHSSVYFYAYH